MPAGVNSTLTHASVTVGASIKRIEVAIPLLNPGSAALRVREKAGLLFAGNIHLNTKTITIADAVGIEPIASIEGGPIREIKLFMGPHCDVELIMQRAMYNSELLCRRGSACTRGAHHTRHQRSAGV